jgi:hypothetical protein
MLFAKFIGIVLSSQKSFEYENQFMYNHAILHDTKIYCLPKQVARTQIMTSVIIIIISGSSI